MSEVSSGGFMPPADSLAGLATPEVQRLAARMAQDAFTRIFRLTMARSELPWAATRMVSPSLSSGAISPSQQGRTRSSVVFRLSVRGMGRPA